MNNLFYLIFLRRGLNIYKELQVSFQHMVYNNFKRSKNPKLQKIEVHVITSKFHSLSSKKLSRKNRRLLIDELQ